MPATLKTAAIDGAPAFHITIADKAETKFWKHEAVTLDEFSKELVHDVRTRKDGPCYVGASFVDPNMRTKKSVREVCFLTYDVDGGQSIDQIEKALELFNARAYLVTTHSHKTTTTEVVVADYERWAAKNKKQSLATVETLSDYLREKGKLRTNVQFTAEPDEGWTQRADVGMVYIVHHDPVDKARIIIPLAAPIVMAQLSLNTEKACARYRDIYAAVAYSAGLNYDKACSDPCRLFYFPSCPKEREQDRVALEIDGELLDWRMVTT